MSIHDSKGKYNVNLRQNDVWVILWLVTRNCAAAEQLQKQNNGTRLPGENDREREGDKWNGKT